MSEGRETIDARRERMLSELQAMAERSSSAERRLRGRMLCRGFRAAWWALRTEPSDAGIKALLLEELNAGIPAHLR